MRVELDLFSGRPNPARRLTPEQGRQFLAHLQALAPCDGPAPAPPSLGYRGVIVTGPPAPFARVRLWAGVAAVCAQGGTMLLHDQERRLERWLVATLGDPALYRLAFGSDAAAPEP